VIKQPVFCITSDIDWASEFSIEYLVKLTEDLGVTPTLFATHESSAIRRFNEEHPNDVGVHPNFLPTSSHGTNTSEVIDNVLRLYPNAKAFRSHTFFDSSGIVHAMWNRGLKYDSNLCLFLQPNLFPLQLGAAPRMTRLPVFWEDDVHWAQTGGNWNFHDYVEAFMSPGLKILNVHPYHVAINTPSEAYYLEHKAHMTTLTAAEAEIVRYDGAGVQTFLVDLIRFVQSRNQKFYTLDQVYKMFPAEAFGTARDDLAGRQTVNSDEDYQQYPTLSESEKQRVVKQGYSQRNARDKYATSRDFHARELEIRAIARSIDSEGSVIDLGCGNGYTLISIAGQLSNRRLVGIDFSENLIDGARYLTEDARDTLQSAPEFICADAIEYVTNSEDASFRYVISERFVQNLPSVESQRNMAREIYRILEPGGRYLMCEGSRAGFQSLNRVREQVGLEVTPETDSSNLSAIRIDDDGFESYLQSEVGFELVEKLGFSEYFLMSRVLHPLMVSPLSPRFDSNLNHYARLIQEQVEFTPGYGSNALWVWRKPLQQY
jgi:ubiquinone/menaquinone biosynthesis C-methylase UbiE